MLTPGGISFWINLFHQRKHRGELVPGFLHGAQAIQNCRKCFSPTLGPVQATCPGKLCDTRVPCSCCERVLKSLFRIRCMAQETQTGVLYQPRGVGWGGRFKWEGIDPHQPFRPLSTQTFLHLGYPHIPTLGTQKSLPLPPGQPEA